MRQSSQTLLSVRDLTVEYAVGRQSTGTLKAVNGVSLEISEAEIFGLVGESGSGKSSLAHAMLQLIKPEAGQVLFLGQDLASINKARLNAARRNIQMVFQDSLASLSPRRSILQSLVEPLNHFRVGAPDGRREQALTTMETVGLDPTLMHRLPHELSGGQRQRAALARALVTEPKLIIADEPVSSLDVSIQARIIELIMELRDRLGIAFLFVSHDLSVVRQLADTVGVMYLGQIVECAATETLFTQPAHPYTKALLDAVPVADPTHPKPVVLPGDPPSPLTPPPGCVFHKRCPGVFEPCSTTEPQESEIVQVEGAPVGAPDFKTTSHRVRCHLWKPTRT